MTDDINRKTTHFPKWTCWRCGLVMDAATHTTENVVPKENDMSVCLNCGALHILHGQQWSKPTEAEFAGIPRSMWFDITRHQLARALAVRVDLTKL